MRRLWAAAILFVCAAALCVWQGGFTARSADAITGELIAACEAAEKGDAETAFNRASAALDVLKNVRGQLCVYTAHSRVDELGRSLSGLPDLARSSSQEQFLSECRRTLSLLSSLRTMDTPTLENIL